MYFVGASSYVTAIVIFVLIVSSTYYQNITQVYLSPNNIPALCTAVLRTSSGSYLADTNGNWDASSNFEPTQALYSFTTRSLSVSDAMYHNILFQLNESIRFTASSMYNNTLSGNLVVWTNWVSTFYYNGTVQIFNINGDVGVIFNRQYALGMMDVLNQLAIT